LQSFVSSTAVALGDRGP